MCSNVGLPLNDADISQNEIIWELIKLKDCFIVFFYCSGTTQILLSERANGTPAILLAKNQSHHVCKDQEG